MNRIPLVQGAMAAAALALTLIPAPADAQSRVQYGRITSIVPTTVTNTSAQTVGTLIGGGVGLASGSGQSGSNRALRTLGGAAAGRGVTNLATRSQAFEYTVLIDGTTTTRIVSDQAGKRIGDCVAIEQGQFSNIRLVPDARCNPAPRPAAPAPAPTPARRPMWKPRTRANRPSCRCSPPIRTMPSRSPSVVCACCAASDAAGIRRLRQPSAARPGSAPVAAAAGRNPRAPLQMPNRT